MFTLGEKFRVLNTSSDVEIFDSAISTSVARSTPALVLASAKATTYFKIKGFGKFDLANLTDFRAARAKAAVVETAKFTTVVPTGLALGNVIEAKITLNTERYEGELANNYIVGGRPIVIQTAPLTAGILATNVSDAIAAAWLQYKSLFNKANFVLNTLTNVGGDLVSTISTGYEGVAVAKIEISISAQGSGSYPKTNLAKVAFTTYGTQGTQGRGLGKFLEESVRVSTADNVRAYGMNSPADTTVDLRGSYTQFNWRMTANYDHALGNDSVDFKPTAEHDFTLFLNESTCMDVAGVEATATKAINLLAAAVVLTAAPAASTIAAAAVTTANYNTIALLNKSDASVLTTVLFTT
jgi:hypothetical protein